MPSDVIEYVTPTIIFDLVVQQFSGASLPPLIIFNLELIMREF
jgi:hypothetical protein